MAAMLQSIDESIGRIVTRLDELGLTNNTIILFTSDNGGNVHSNTEEDRGKKANIGPGHPQWQHLENYRKYAGYQPPTNNYPLRKGKGTLYEGGIRVPLIVSWPGQVPAGAKSSEPVCSIDFYPTLIELANVSKREDVRFDGVSLAPILRGSASKLDREAIFNFFPHGGPAKPPGVVVRKGPWKLIRWFETGPEYPLLHELYNLEQDLGETRNLAQQQPELVKELDSLIDGFLADTKALIPKAI
jgi:arylsulfatase A-like enzyme